MLHSSETADVPLSLEEQLALNGIVTDLDKLLDASTGMIPSVVNPPVSTSPIAVAYAADEREAFDIARVLLLSSRDHLRAITAIAKAGSLPLFALYTLLRGGAEAVVRARHLLDPQVTHADRVARALNERLENLEEQEKVGISASGHLIRRVAHLESRATKLGIVVVRNKKGDIVGFGEPKVSAVELFERYLPAGAKTFRLLSAYAHSRPWMLVGIQKAQPSSDPGVSTVQIELNVTLVLKMLAGVASLFDETVGFWVLLAGQPLEVWRLTKGPVT